MADFSKAIPTEYGGVRFKSRMEAQCARLFDMCKLPWTYETESVLLANGHAYLLDFEVKDTDGDRKYAVECRGYSTPKGNAQIAGFSREFVDRGYLYYIIIGPDCVWGFDGSPEPKRMSLTFCHHCNKYLFGVLFDGCDECSDSLTSDWSLQVAEGKILVNGKPAEEWDISCAG